MNSVKKCAELASRKRKTGDVYKSQAGTHYMWVKEEGEVPSWLCLKTGIIYRDKEAYEDWEKLPHSHCIQLEVNK